MYTHFLSSIKWCFMLLSTKYICYSFAQCDLSLKVSKSKPLWKIATIDVCRIKLDHFSQCKHHLLTQGSVICWSFITELYQTGGFLNPHRVQFLIWYVNLGSHKLPGWDVNKILGHEGLSGNEKVSLKTL